MTVGMPGTGIGGMFYMMSALAMPLIEAWRRSRGRPAGSWRVVLGQLALTGGILAAMTATGWLIVTGLAALRRVVPPVLVHSDGLPSGSVLRTAMLVLTVGTLAVVLLGVELLRLWVHRHGKREPSGEHKIAAPATRARPRRSATAGRVRLLLVLGTGAAIGMPTAAAQTQRRVMVVVDHLARADSAFRTGNAALAAHEYAIVLATEPRNSHAVYRLAQLRPDEALQLFRLYVTLEPADPWGYIAVADALRAAGRHDEALQWYDSALRLAPRERDAVIGRAHVLADAGRTDAARAAYQPWLAAHPTDAPAWRELARLDLRAGRPGDAARALERVQTLTPDPNVAKLLAAARGAAAPAITPLSTGSYDSDGNSTLRFGGTADLAISGPTRLGVTASRAHTGDGTTTAGFADLSLVVSARPRAGLRLDGVGGATRIDAQGGAPAATIPTGQLRARWRAPGARTAVDLRVERKVLDATPVLLANQVVRNELGGVLQLPVAKIVRLRGVGRFAALHDTTGTNRRATVTGVVAFAVSPSVELSGQFHQTGYAHASTSGYFAPRLAQVAEAGSYFEFQAPGSAVFAFDLGAGVQRVADQDAPFGSWRGAFRLYALTSVPLAPGRELRLEFDAENSGVANEAATTTGQWRYATATLSLRWAMR